MKSLLKSGLLILPLACTSLAFTTTRIVASLSSSKSKVTYATTGNNNERNSTDPSSCYFLDIPEEDPDPLPDKEAREVLVSPIRTIELQGGGFEAPWTQSKAAEAAKLLASRIQEARRSVKILSEEPATKEFVTSLREALSALAMELLATKKKAKNQRGQTEIDLIEDLEELKLAIIAHSDDFNEELETLEKEYTRSMLKNKVELRILEGDLKD